MDKGRKMGGLWTLPVSWATWQGGSLPQALNCLGFEVAAVGGLSAVPGLHAPAGPFGLSET